MRLSLSFLVLAATAPAASGQLELCWSDGVIGSGVDYQLEGAPGLGYALIPSLTTGPTPLAFIDPADPRLLDVGIDLLNFMDVGFLDPTTGEATVTYPLPANPALAGFTLYAQAVDFPGATSIFGNISNRVEFTLSSLGDTWPAHNEDTHARRFAATARLQDGSWLIAGGQTPDLPRLLHDNAVRFDPKIQSYVAGLGTLPEVRSRATATTLNDGRVLIVGGYGNAGVHASTVLFDPAAGTFAAGPVMSTPRVMHTATKLADGRVFVAGGSTDFTQAHPIGYPASVTAAVNGTTEIFNPATNLWSAGPALLAPVTTAGAALLSDGRVLIAGGIEVSAGLTPVTTAACSLFDPGGPIVTPTDPILVPRQHIGISPLISGGVIVVGGANVDFTTLVTTVHDDAWVYDEGTEKWSPTTPSPQSIRCGQVICTYTPKGNYVLGNGLLGLDLLTGAAAYSRDVYALDETLTTWTLVGTLSQDRMGGALLDLDNGIHILGTGSGGGPPGAYDKSGDVLTCLDPNGC